MSYDDLAIKEGHRGRGVMALVARYVCSIVCKLLEAANHPSHNIGRIQKQISRSRPNNVASPSQWLGRKGEACFPWVVVVICSDRHQETHTHTHTYTDRHQAALSEVNKKLMNTKEDYEILHNVHSRYRMVIIWQAFDRSATGLRAIGNQWQSITLADERPKFNIYSDAQVAYSCNRISIHIYVICSDALLCNATVLHTFLHFHFDHWVDHCNRSRI